MDTHALARRAGQLSLDRGLKLAVAESCTGGLLGGAITGVPGSSRYFLGGFIVYSDTLKVELLGVPEEVIDRDGAVSEAVVRSMAEGAARVTGADLAVAVTGVAGPEGTEEKPPGTVWLAVTAPEETTAELLTLRGDRKAVRREAVDRALRLMIRCLERCR